MSRELPNELEERRVMRLLAGAEQALPPLADVEVETLLRIATAAPSANRARRPGFAWRPRLVSLGAVAAALALAVLLPAHEHAERQAGPPQAAYETQLVAFPAGSALSLLLSRSGERT